MGYKLGYAYNSFLCCDRVWGDHRTIGGGGADHHVTRVAERLHSWQTLRLVGQGKSQVIGHELVLLLRLNYVGLELQFKRKI